MDAGIGPTRENQELFFFGSCEPFEGSEHSDKFALNRANIGLDLATMIGISEVTDSKKQPNVLGQNTLSSFVRTEGGDGVLGGKSERPNGPFQGLF